jgi:hypothetical protein
MCFLGRPANKQVLKAIIDAFDEKKHLVPRLTGVMFFATPHRGSKQAETGEMLARTANAATRITTLGIAKAPFRVDQIKELQKKSLQLHEIHSKFSRRASQLDVRSFFETRETAFIGRRAGIVRILPFLYLCLSIRNPADNPRLWTNNLPSSVLTKRSGFQQCIVTLQFVDLEKMTNFGLLSAKTSRTWQDRRCRTKLRVEVMVMASFDHVCTLLKLYAGYFSLDIGSKATQIKGLFAISSKFAIHD